MPPKKGGVKSSTKMPPKKGGVKSSTKMPPKKGGVKYPIKLTPLENPPRTQLPQLTPMFLHAPLIRRSSPLEKPPYENLPPIIASRSSSKHRDLSSNMSPKKLLDVTDDAQLKIVESFILTKISNIVSKISNILDESLILEINKIIAELSILSKINKHFKKLVSDLIQTTLKKKIFDKIEIINLVGSIINKNIVDVLNMTNPEVILSIILRDIMFDGKRTCREFLKFFEKNVNITVLIFERIDDEDNFSEFLKVVQTFEYIVWLEIISCKLYDTYKKKGPHEYSDIFLQVLLNLKSLKYLTFNKNYVEPDFRLFLTQNKQTVNTYTLNNINYNIYIVGGECWYMKIEGPEISKKIKVDIQDNLGVKFDQNSNSPIYVRVGKDYREYYSFFWIDIDKKKNNGYDHDLVWLKELIIFKKTKK